jgi:hypothetical protein
MIEVSDAWLAAHKQTILPETFLEITFDVTDDGVSELVNVIAENEASFSNSSAIAGSVGTPVDANYATLEPNLWVLDGSKNIIPDEAPYNTPGYVSADDSDVSLTLSLSEARSKAIPGITIIWSSEYDEYPTSFTVSAKIGENLVASTTVTDNDSSTSVVEMELSNYDSVTITPHDWNFPDHRKRIDRVFFGYAITFGKDEILGYTHEQHGSLLSTELPKNSIDFTLNNADGRWNMANPGGIGRYLYERQRVRVRYGMDINGSTEWIKAGTFYLSEWDAPSNGMEARFVARDVFEFLLGETCPTSESSRIDNLIQTVLRKTGVPTDVGISVDPTIIASEETVNAGDDICEVLKLLSNSEQVAMWQDRNGVLVFENMMNGRNYAEGTIELQVAYSYPETELSKPLREITIPLYRRVQTDGGIKFEPNGATYTATFGSEGEVLTINNRYIGYDVNASHLANYTNKILKHRTIVSGEFRADPRFDVFDVVHVESKFGLLKYVVLTDIKYTYNGSFRGSYTGRVRGDGVWL